MVVSRTAPLPVTVTVLTATQIRGVTTVSNLPAAAPASTFRIALWRASIDIRTSGVGTTLPNRAAAAIAKLLIASDPTEKVGAYRTAPLPMTDTAS